MAEHYPPFAPASAYPTFVPTAAVSGASRWNAMVDIRPPRFPQNHHSFYSPFPPLEKQQQSNWENLSIGYPRFLSPNGVSSLHPGPKPGSFPHEELLAAIKRHHVVFGEVTAQSRKMATSHDRTELQPIRDYEISHTLMASAGLSPNEASLIMDCARPPHPPPLIRPKGEDDSERGPKSTIEHKPDVEGLFDASRPLCLDLRQVQKCHPDDIYPSIGVSNRTSSLSSSSVDFLDNRNEIFLTGVQFVKFYDHKLLALYCGSGEPYFCVNQLVDDVLEGVPNCLARMDTIAKQCNWVLPRPAEQVHLHALKKCDIIRRSDQHCGLIQRSLAEFLVQWCLISCNLESAKHSPGVDEIITNHSSSVSLTDQVYLYHECFGFNEGVFIPGTFDPSNEKQDNIPMIKCLNCKKLLKCQNFVCHSHNVPSYEHHWGFSSENWFLYIHVSERQDKYEHKRKLWQEIVNKFVADQSDCFSPCESSPSSCVEIISDDEIRSLNESQETQSGAFRCSMLPKMEVNEETDFEECDEDLAKPTNMEGEEPEVEDKKFEMEEKDDQQFLNKDDGTDGEICVVDHKLSDICRCNATENPKNLKTQNLELEKQMSPDCERSPNPRNEVNQSGSTMTSEFQHPEVSSPIIVDVVNPEGEGRSTDDYSPTGVAVPPGIMTHGSMIYNVPLCLPRPKSCFGFETNTNDEPGMDVNLVPRCLSAGVIDCYYQEDYSQELPLISSLMLESNLQPNFLFPTSLIHPKASPSIDGTRPSSSDVTRNDSSSSLLLNSSKWASPLSVTVATGKSHLKTGSSSTDPQDDSTSPHLSVSRDVTPSPSGAKGQRSGRSGTRRESEEDWEERSNASASSLKPLNLSLKEGETQVPKDRSSQSASPSASELAQRKRMTSKLKRPLAESDGPAENIPKKLQKRGEFFTSHGSQMESNGQVFSQSEARKSRSRHLRHIHQSHDRFHPTAYEYTDKTFPVTPFDMTHPIANHLRSGIHKNNAERNPFLHPIYAKTHPQFSPNDVKSGTLAPNHFLPPNLAMTSLPPPGARANLESSAGFSNPEQILESSFALLQTELSKLPLKEGLFLNRIYASLRAQVVQQLFQWRKLVAQKNEVIKKLFSEIDASRKRLDNGVQIPGQMFNQSDANFPRTSVHSTQLPSRVQSIPFAAAAAANLAYQSESSANSMFGRPVPSSVGVPRTQFPMLNSRFPQYQPHPQVLAPQSFPSRPTGLGSLGSVGKNGGLYPFVNHPLSTTCEKTPGFLASRARNSDYDFSSPFLSAAKKPKLPFTNLQADSNNIL